jgi:putative flippase GtrA
VAGILLRIPLIAFTHRPFVHMVQKVAPLTNYAERIGENMALALSVLVVMFWNFFVNRYWTYNDVE